MTQTFVIRDIADVDVSNQVVECGVCALPGTNPHNGRREWQFMIGLGVFPSGHRDQAMYVTIPGHFHRTEEDAIRAGEALVEWIRRSKPAEAADE